MKNIILFVLLFSCMNGFAQSNFSFSIVAKYGETKIAKDENTGYQPQLIKPGESFSFGIMANHFFNKKQNFSFEYGFINQISSFSGTSVYSYNSGVEEIYTTTDYKLQNFDALFPLKIRGHWKGLSIGGGIIPTYHFQSNINEIFTTETSEGILKSESNFSPCQALLGECFRRGKFDFLNDMDLQYGFDLSYEILRTKLFVEYSNYLWRNDDLTMHQNFAFVDIAYNPIFYAKVGSTLNIGAAFKIY